MVCRRPCSHSCRPSLSTWCLSSMSMHRYVGHSFCSPLPLLAASFAAFKTGRVSSSLSRTSTAAVLGYTRAEEELITVRGAHTSVNAHLHTWTHTQHTHTPCTHTYVHTHNVHVHTTPPTYCSTVDSLRYQNSFLSRLLWKRQKDYISCSSQ